MAVATRERSQVVRAVSGEDLHALRVRMAQARLPKRGLSLPQLAASECQQSFLAFLAHLWTVDEARAGEVRPWPMSGAWGPLWRDWETALLLCSPLLVDKTRRVMASNVVCAWDLWICLGGADPRWPALMLSSANRRVLVQSRKLEGPGGSAEFVGRAATMLRISEERGLRKAWPGMPRWDTKFGVIECDHGGRIDAVPQGADQVRGPGTTHLHTEELSFQEQAQASCEAAIPALHPFGHLTAVTTPAAATYAARIRRGDIGGDR